MRKAEKEIAFLILLAVSAITLPIFSDHLSSLLDSAALSVTPEEFQSLIVGHERVAAFFSTAGCVDCERMRSLWHVLSMKYSGSMSFVEIEYGLMASAIFDRYDIVQTPTFILFARGENVSRYDGSFSSLGRMDQFLQTGYGTSQKASLPLSESSPILISTILGVSVFASPCVLPMLPGYLAVVFGSNKRGKGKVGVASLSAFAFGALSILLIGFIFVVLGDLFWSLLLMGKLLVSFVLLALGLAVLFEVTLSGAPRILDVPSKRGFSRRVSTYSLLFGFLSLSCSLPFLVGASLNIVAGIDVYSMVLRLFAFAFGFAVPLAALTFATGVGLNLSASKLSRASGIMSKVGGVSMIAASLLVLITV